ncbi:MAG TPA: glycosyltransferase family A protein [Magnetospirillaceae bacterium]|nr:glycosyltransferase family A protein [Magnetospirillaceae bacterium]
MTGSFTTTFAHPGVSLQQPFDVAVVMPTILRPEIAPALASIFSQNFSGRIQVLVGIDVARGDPSLVQAACALRPANCVVQLFYPGYSTSGRHGGLGEAWDGGVLRTVLSFLANSRLVAYLDDDNWWHPNHLHLLAGAIRDRDYAFSQRWFVHHRTGRIVARDDWESLGPGRGIYSGGFVDPNCLMLNKIRCADILPLWTKPLRGDPKAMSADRTVFAALAERFQAGAVGQPTVYYRLDPNDVMHAERMKAMGPLYAQAGG